MAPRKNQRTKPVSKPDDERIVELEKRMNLASRGFNELSARLDKASRWGQALQKRVLTLENENKRLEDLIDAREKHESASEKGRPDFSERSRDIGSTPQDGRGKMSSRLASNSPWKVGVRVRLTVHLQGPGIPDWTEGTVVAINYAGNVMVEFDVVWYLPSGDRKLSHRGWHATQGIVELIDDEETQQAQLEN